eukprot:16437873-Heterocapsa_arctica.AAC.1
MKDGLRAAVLQTFQRYLLCPTVGDSWKSLGPAFVTWFGAGMEMDKGNGSESDDGSPAKVEDLTETVGQ